MVEEQFIFQIDSPLVKSYFDNSNFIIEYSNSSKCDNNICAIYFSSHEIYYPNSLKAFNYSIVKRNKFEWRNNRFPKARKHIFLRDLRKQWYIGGINSQLDDVLKVKDFLEKETFGFRVYTIGSSAGGFASILFGSMLNAERVYTFNNQFNLFKIVEASSVLVDPILFAMQNNPKVNQFFDLSKFIKPNINYFYFQSVFSKIDYNQYNCISDSSKNSIKRIKFLTDKHGFPFLKSNIPTILSYNNSRLNYLVSKTFHPIIFSIEVDGIFFTIKSLFNSIYKKISKKYISYLHFE
jgi:hypothetical protein